MISGRIQYVLGYLFGECFNSKLRFDDGKIENGSESVVTEDNQGPFTPKGIIQNGISSLFSKGTNSTNFI